MISVTKKNTSSGRLELGKDTTQNEIIIVSLGEYLEQNTHVRYTASKKKHYERQRREEQEKDEKMKLLIC